MANTQEARGSAKLSGGGGAASGAPVRLRTITLPPRMPRQRYRPAQPNIPDARSVREMLKRIAAAHVAREGVVPPLTMEELCEHAGPSAGRRPGGLS